MTGRSRHQTWIVDHMIATSSTYFGKEKSSPKQILGKGTSTRNVSTVTPPWHYLKTVVMEITGKGTPQRLSTPTYVSVLPVTSLPSLSLSLSLARLSCSSRTCSNMALFAGASARAVVFDGEQVVVVLYVAFAGTSVRCTPSPLSVVLCLHPLTLKHQKTQAIRRIYSRNTPSWEV